MARLKDKVYPELLHKLSLKYQIPEKMVEAVILSQFRLLKDTMERGDLESIRLQHLGLFFVRPTTIMRASDEPEYLQEITGDNLRMEEFGLPKSGSGGGSLPKS